MTDTVYVVTSPSGLTYETDDSQVADRLEAFGCRVRAVPGGPA